MTRERSEHDLGNSIQAWMNGTAPASMPVIVLEEAFARTMSSRQVHVFPWQRLARGRPRPAGMTGFALLAAAAVTIAVLAFGTLGVGFGPPAGPTPSPSPTPSASPSPSPPPSAGPALSPSPPAVVPVPIVPTARVAAPGTQSLATDGKALWLLTETGSVALIDPATNKAGPPIQTGGKTDLYNGISVDKNGVWVTDWDTTTLFRIDPTTSKAKAIEVGPFLKGVLATGSAVWVAATHDGKIYRIDPATNKVVATVTVGPSGNSGPNWLGSGFGSIWVSVPNAMSIVRIDPVTNAVQATIKAPAEVLPCGSFAFTATDVWTQSCSDVPTMARIDPATNVVEGFIRSAGPMSAAVVINGSAWISVDTRPAAPRYLARLSSKQDALDLALTPGQDFGGGGDLVVAGGSAWVIDGGNDRILRLPMTAFVPG